MLTRDLFAVANLPVIKSVTGHLSERSFVRNVVVKILKFDAKPNPKPNTNPNHSHILALTNSSPNPNLALTITQTLTLALAITLTLSNTFRTNDPSDK